MLAYEPARRFTGADSITVEIIYRLGHSAKRHYAISGGEQFQRFQPR